MMLKITERCTMGCKHCLNSASPDGKDMTFEVLNDSLEFLRKNNLANINLIITGGEPTEHRNFDEVMDIIFKFNKKYAYFNIITITTNGEAIQNDYKKFIDYIKIAKSVGIKLLFQVSADTRYYTRRINTHKRVFREDGFILCDNCIVNIYPQGRALDNNLPWIARGSKCFNVRALSHQLGEHIVLKDIEMELLLRNKFCTPHISINGDIKLGESDLCPKCASIYDDMNTIMDGIRTFKCDKCNHINDSLPPVYKKYLN